MHIYTRHSFLNYVCMVMEPVVASRYLVESDETAIDFIPFARMLETPTQATIPAKELTLPATDRLRLPDGTQSAESHHRVAASNGIVKMFREITDWVTFGIWGVASKYKNQEVHTRLILGIGGLTEEQATFFKMFVDGARISALVSAGLHAAELPTIGIGIEEWHGQAGFGAKELSAINGTWQDLLAMGFTIEMMFTRRRAFGPHILAFSPFCVTFDTLLDDMDVTLQDLVRGYHATSSDLSLLGVNWKTFLSHGGDPALLCLMDEASSVLEMNLQAPQGVIRDLTSKVNVADEGKAKPMQQISRAQFKSFVM